VKFFAYRKGNTIIFFPSSFGCY
jgi:predicted RNA-binding protein with PUA-like domain